MVYTKCFHFSQLFLLFRCSLCICDVNNWRFPYIFDFVLMASAVTSITIFLASQNTRTTVVTRHQASIPSSFPLTASIQVLGTTFLTLVGVTMNTAWAEYPQLVHPGIVKMKNVAVDRWTQNPCRWLVRTLCTLTWREWQGAAVDHVNVEKLCWKVIRL